MILSIACYKQINKQKILIFSKKVPSKLHIVSFGGVDLFAKSPVIRHLQNAWALAPDVMRVLTKASLSDIDPIIGLKAIYIQSLSEK